MLSTPERLRRVYGNTDIPSKLANGSVKDRSITLPNYSRDSAELLPRHTTMAEGIANPAFSDVTGSTDSLARAREENGLSSDSADTVVRRRGVHLGAADVRDSSTSLDSVGQRRSPWKPWDVFRVMPRSKDKTLDDTTISLFRKIVKVVVGVFLTLAILVMTLLSKSTLLLMTSNIYVNVTLWCEEGPDKTFTTCKRVPPDSANATVPYRPSQAVQVRWVWALILTILTPYVFMFSKSLWRVCFKHTRSPSWKPMLAVIITETCHTVGLCLFVFQVLPNLDTLRGFVLTFGVAFVPSALKIFDRQDDHRKSFCTVLLDLLAMFVQASVLLLWPVRNLMKREYFTEAWSIPVSLFLISIGYWQNYVNRYSVLGGLGTRLRSLKKEIRRSRTKTYLAVSILKIVLTLAAMTVIMSDGTMECVRTLYFLGDDTAESCPHLVYPEGIKNVESSGYFSDPFWVMLLQIFAGLFCYTFAKTACKILLQVGSFAMPLTLSMPILLGVVISQCETWRADTVQLWLPAMPSYLFWTCDIHGSTVQYLYSLVTEWYIPAAVGWWLSFLWVTCHIWFPRVERLVQTERLFVQPLYCGVLLEQSLILNRRRDDKDREARTERPQSLGIFEEEQRVMDAENPFKPRGSLRTDVTPMIYVCATMWHETEKEMIQIMTSLFRLDLDQCTRKHAYLFFDVVDPDYYEFEAHIFFDDAFDAHDKDEYEYKANDFVTTLVQVMSTAASKVHKANVRMDSPTKYPTPYGGRLEWNLPGQNKLIVHLKDKAKIRHKKRWSQVMYMYYLLGHRLVAQPLPDARRKQTIADNTYILTLDGDIDFRPSAVRLLVDRMKKNDKVGAACGRIHPVGTGPMVWYQKFEYAVSHWLQKATEHMIGCVLCSPGCFSLFRASALMDDNVMRKYATMSSEAKHYVQFDQGEDRWLCTLLLQQGYRVEYCAAADALTYCPEGFHEFYNQRRRWSPSTMANIMDLLQDWRNVIKINDNISLLYIFYQLLLFVSSILTPGTIFLLIVGAINMAFSTLGLLSSLIANLVPVLLFMIVCYFARSQIQLYLAAILSIVYALVMMLVVVGLALAMKRDGICAPTTIFMIFVVGVFIISAIMHPLEFTCLFHGVLYFLAVPSMSMLLMIYSICNLHVVSWGTREVVTPQKDPQKKELEQVKKKVKDGAMASIINMFTQRFHKAEQQEGDYGCSFGNLFSCICCPKPKENKEDLKFTAVLQKLEQLEGALTGLKNDVRSLPATPASLQTVEEQMAASADVINSEQVAPTPLTPTAPTAAEGAGDSSLIQNPLFAEKVYDDEYSPYWIHDSMLGRGTIRYLGGEEVRFWKELVDKYLFPLENDQIQKDKIQRDLLQLRNKMSLMFFILNALFIVIIFSLQYTNAQMMGNGLAIPIFSCKTETGSALTLEPISLVFMAIFGIALLIQFLAMFFHRTGTFLHIVASTEVNFLKLNQSEVAAMDVSDKLALVRTMQSFRDDDDTKSVSSMSSMDSVEDDSSITADDSPKPRRRKTVLRLTKKRRSSPAQSGSLASKFMNRYLKLAQDLKSQRISEGSDKSRSSSKRRQRQGSNRRSLRAMKKLEQEKEAVVGKAQKWQRLTRARGTPGGDQAKEDPWVALVKSVLTQSRTSLNTISEEDPRYAPLLSRTRQRLQRSGSQDLGLPSQLEQMREGRLRASFPGPARSHLTSVMEATSSGDVSDQYERIELDSSNSDERPDSVNEGAYQVVDAVSAAAHLAHAREDSTGAPLPAEDGSDGSVSQTGSVVAEVEMHSGPTESDVSQNSNAPEETTLF